MYLAMHQALPRDILVVKLSKAAIEIPLSAIIFIIILIIVFVLILLWHFGGFDIFKKILGNVTCETFNNTSQGAFKKC